MIIGILIAFLVGVAVGALLQSHLSNVAMLRRRAAELEESRRHQIDD